MAIEQWSKLPKDIIQVIATILSSDVDTLRLRSVCSHWRSSLRRRHMPSPFPLQVPPPLFFDKGILHYWKFGDQDWVGVDNGNHKMYNIVLEDGKCYGIGGRGHLLVADSNFNVTVVPSLPPLPVYPRKLPYFYLASYESELYVLSITSGKGDGVAIEVKIFKKSDGVWEHIKCLGDKLFLFCNDVIVGLSSKDFCGCKGNCFYVSPDQLSAFGDEIVYAEYDLGQGWSSVKNWGEEVHTVICKPPPKWLLSN